MHSLHEARLERDWLTAILQAVGQICSTASMALNLAQCQVLAKKAVEAGAKALFLPEASDYIASSPTQSLALCQPTSTSPFVQGLISTARKHSLAINVGVHEPSPTPARLHNTLLTISPRGDLIHPYRKLHLFTIDLSHTTPPGPILKESTTTSPGTHLVPPFPLPLSTPEHSNPPRNTSSSTSNLRIGAQICFDLRFPEPSLSLRNAGANILLYPSAFTVPTGKLHWGVLLRARAIENQCYVIAAAQVGRHNAGRVSYGGSTVVDPNGVVLGVLGSVEDERDEKEGAREPEVLVVDVDEGVVEGVRRGLPVGELRRWDVYPRL